MFRGLINDAKSAVGSVLARYATRAAVIGVFILSAGFATAAVAGWLAQRYGTINACWMLAAGFLVIGLVAAMFVSWQETKVEQDEIEAVADDTASVSTEAAAQAAAQIPIALLGTLLTTPMGPSTTASLARFIGRNLSLFIFLGLIAFLFWPSRSAETEADSSAQGSEPVQA